MAKHNILLAAFRNDLNNWVCRMHNSGNANQSAATFREIKKQGYSFEETGPKRWDKSLYCTICKTKTTHSFKKLKCNLPGADSKRKYIYYLL